MKKKRLLFNCLFLLIFLGCKTSYSQERVEYIFPPKVNDLLDEKISTHRKTESNAKYYIILRRVTWVEERGNYLLSIGAPTESPIELIENLIGKSAHFYRSGAIEIPIIFDYDFAFTGHEKDSKGRIVRKNLTGGGEFSIEFNQKGEIVD